MRISPRGRWAAASCVVVAVGLALAVAATRAGLSPSSASFTLRAGGGALGTATETKTVTVPATPASADVEIAIDTTGSMGPSIAQAKTDANAIVTGVQGSVANTQFAVVQFKDSGDSPEYQVAQSMTSNAAAVQSAINGFSASGGGDFPEAYNLVFNNSYNPSSDGPIGWRSGTRKFVIVIGDAQPHGAGSAGFAGCTDTSADPHSFNTATEIAGMAAAQRTLLMIRQVSSNTTVTLPCYQSLAAAGFTGGAAVDGGGSLATQIVNLINAAFANVNNVHLEVVSAGPAPASALWVTFSPASVGPVPAPSTQTFTLTVTVPPGTPANTYLFDIRAVADGVDIGHQALTIIVPAKQITITPPATNTIGTSHTVVAHVFDVLGPFVGDTVLFSVAGGPAAVPSSGSATTNGSGNASFTFSNTPPALGTNTITANDGGLTASTTKTWTRPPLDDFKCYKVKRAGKLEPTSVLLHDQFGDRTAVVSKLVQLCNPVEKNGVRIKDPTAHLNCYKIKTEDHNAKLDVLVTNQFGTQRLRVKKPRLLCAPASKGLPGTQPGPVPLTRDHFQCYQVKQFKGLGFTPVTVSLVDQFGPEEAVVAKPVRLCNPVDKTHDGVTTPALQRQSHLVCYKIKVPHFSRLSVNTRDQFGLHALLVKKPQMLCVKSEKTVIPTDATLAEEADDPDDGDLDEDEDEG